jgi:hypothetical protein
VPHQHQPAAVPVIMDEADKDILLDAQRPCTTHLGFGEEFTR